VPFDKLRANGIYASVPAAPLRSWVLDGCPALLYNRASMAQRGVAVLIIVLVLVGLAWAGGVFDGLQDIDAIRAAIEDAGAWGPPLYILAAMAAFTVFMLSFPVWAAAAVWPPHLAFAYSFAAAILGSMLVYCLTVALGRAWARERVPPSLALWEARLEARPIVALVSLRLLLWANPLVDMLLAVSRVPPRDYVIGTVLGLAGPTAFQVGMGAGGSALLSHLATRDIPWWQWLLVVALLGAIGAGALHWRRKGSNASDRSDSSELSDESD